MKLSTIVLFLGTAATALAIPPPPAPDSGTTAGLLAIAVAGLLLARRHFGRGK